MGLRERIGVDVGRHLKLEDAIQWAAKHEVRHIDIQLDTADNAEKKKALILLENLNKEPEAAEVHYLAHTVEDPLL